MSAATPRSYKPGQSLFGEGDASKSLFIITKGAVSIRKTKGKSFVEIGKVTTNEVIGELSFFDRMPRSASAIAITDVEALELTFDALEKVYNTMPDYLKTIVASLAGRLRKANEQLKLLQKQRIGD